MDGRRCRRSANVYAVCLKMIKSLIYARPVPKFQCLLVAAVTTAFLLSVLEGVVGFDKPTVEYMDECKIAPPTYGNSRAGNSGFGSTEDVAVTCHLRTINSEFDKTNFSRITGQAIVSLTLQCSDVLFYQSSLEARSFSHISRLESIHIEHCKLSRLPAEVFSGLSNVRNITVRTYNTAWPALSLDIAQGAFDSLPHLERIDLSSNNIWTFPEKLFCSSKNLESLNVSLNRLQDIIDLSFRDKTYSRSQGLPSSVSGLSSKKSAQGCKSEIQILDISNNRLILLPPAGLATLSSLNELFVQDNEISVVSVDALAGLKMLKVLNLAHNKVVSLPEGLFQDSPEITEIYLHNNSLSSLAPKLFAKLNQMIVLNLSHNALTQLTSESESESESDTNIEISGNRTESRPRIFSGLIRLVLLNLSYNRLTHLSSATFSDLYSLQILNVEHNLVRSIEANTFSPMKNLHTLILSHNALTSIDSTSLNGLFVLSLLSLNNNNISAIDPTAFLNCSSLKDLNLNGNILSHVPLALQNLTFLKTIDLGENVLDQLETPRLIGLPNLYGLRLTGNRLTNVSKGALEELVSLKVLNLARNRIQTVEQGAFDSNTNLQAVRLDANFLSDISSLFVESPNLIWLNLSDNQLNWFDYSLIPKQLQWLDLHKNEISDLGNYFQRIDLRLQTLDASFNRITKLSSTNIPDGLEMLFLNDNLIFAIEPHTFYNKLNLSRVDIFANQIETLELNSLRLSPVDEGRSLPEFFIGGNPITCDCNMEWLQRINSLDHLRQHPRVMDLDSVYCKLVYHREKYYLPLAQADPSQYLCSYKTHCFALCHCCDFDACDCEMTCPYNCTCYHDDTWSTNIVDCAAKEHTHVPARIPMDSTEIYLDGNNFEELSSHVFIGRKNLQVLYLNHSRIDKISNNSFSGLRRLAMLHLEHNFLTELYGFEFEPLESVRELYLQNNQLTFISNNTFATLRGLEVLKLNGNRLTRFTAWMLSQNPYLVDIALSDNPWSCDCDFVTLIAPWVQTNIAKITDASEMTCEQNGESYSLFKNENVTQCSDIDALARPVETATKSSLTINFLVIGGPIVLCIILCCVLVILCRRKVSLKIWAESKCPLKQCYQSTTHDADDSEKLYDAYVAYSVKDEIWVNRILATQLQMQNGTETPYRLCLHYKDFPATAYMSDKILEAVESSKMTILVLSKNFIQSEWCRFEFKSALHSALRGKRKRLIAITLGDLPSRDLDPDLRVALRSAIVLSVNDKQFLTKLRCALPDPSPISFSATNSNTTSRGRLIPSTEHYHPNSHSGHNFHMTSQNGLDVHMNMNFPYLSRNGTIGCQIFPELDSTRSSESLVVPVYVPPFPPPNRPPPPFPSSARGPPPPIPTAAGRR